MNRKSIFRLRPLAPSGIAVCLTLGSLALTICPALVADTVVYTTLNDGSNGDYTSGGTASQNSRIVADDISFAAGSAGAEVDHFTFTVFNGNSTAASGSAQLVFYANDGPNGGPGTVLYNIGVFPLPLGGNTSGTYTLTSSTGFFTIPADNSIWAGIYYLPNTTNNAFNFGQIVYGVPTVGSSTINIFQSTAAGSTASDPAGAFATINSPDKFNLGWSFSAINFPDPVPEPSSVVLLGMTGMSGLGMYIRRGLFRRY
jgi:hypothetical protein